jgi:uncharacterized protein YpuA (DUF1002 family)
LKVGVRNRIYQGFRNLTGGIRTIEVHGVTFGDAQKQNAEQLLKTAKELVN